jgi:CBS domain-containing protein
MTTRHHTRRRSPQGGLRTVRVREAMHTGVVACPREASLLTIARTMAAHRIHSVVVDSHDVATGEPEWAIVSDLDLVAAAYEGSLGGRSAASIAGSPPLVVEPDDTLSRAAQLMHEYGTTHAIVSQRGSRRPLGVISTLDVIDALTELPDSDG